MNARASARGSGHFSYSDSATAISRSDSALVAGRSLMGVSFGKGESADGAHDALAVAEIVRHHQRRLLNPLQPAIVAGAGESVGDGADATSRHGEDALAD